MRKTQLNHSQWVRHDFLDPINVIQSLWKLILGVNILSNFRNAQKGKSSGFLSNAVFIQSFNKAIFLMVHSIWNVPSVIDDKKDIFVCVIPLDKLVRILNYENMIFSCLKNLIFVADILDVRLKSMMSQYLIKLVGVSFGCRILKMLIFIENYNVLFFWVICVFF